MWKSIKGYEGIYEISNLGRVKSLERLDTMGRRIEERIMKCQLNKDGYLNITLSNKGCKKTYLLHRLVAMHFVDNPNGYNEINHIDTDPSNPVASNLEWCTRKYNVNYADAKEKMIRANQKKVIQLDLANRYVKTHDSIKGAAKEVKIPDSNISACCKGKRPTAGGYKWEYAI